MHEDILLKIVSYISLKIETQRSRKLNKDQASLITVSTEDGDRAFGFHVQHTALEKVKIKKNKAISRHIIVKYRKQIIRKENIYIKQQKEGHITQRTQIRRPTFLNNQNSIFNLLKNPNNQLNKQSC